jgi:class 3 adenylate cyclase/tetratricopeptide (TPR) repeat protein
MSKLVSEWLNDLGLGQYAAMFKDNDIDWELLIDVDKQTLKDIGVESAGHRLRLLKAIESFDPSLSPAESSESKSKTRADDDLAGWSRTPGERKPVTMLFADIVGSTALTEKLDAEDAHDLLYLATQLMCQSVENNKGTVCRFMGDGIMAMFGAPVASERHALEACHAALEMQTNVDNYASELESSQAASIQIRIGLHSGEVVVLEVGDDPDKPEYDASGPTVPMAARLEQSAEAGTIQISEQTRSLAGNLIETKEIPTILVKGISEPVVIHRLQKIISATEPTSTTAPKPIIGRKSELAQFGGLLEACMESWHGQTIFVRGEAGIGKSRLVEELTHLAKARGFMSHKALVLDFGAGKGQEAVPSLLRSLIGIAHVSGKSERVSALDRAEKAGIVVHENRIFLNDLLDLKQPLELRTLYDAMDPQARKEGKRFSIMEMVTKLSARKPVFIVIEDLHWADDTTLDYLAKLATTVAECPAIMVFTSRAEGDPIDTTWRARAGDPSIVTWDLSPLRKEESLELVAGFIDASDSLAKRCIERAAGNPLFLEQLLLGVEKGSSESVPDSIKSLVLARMDHLPVQDKQALRAAAVLGQRFELEGLRYLIDTPDYGCLSLVEHHLLRPEGVFYLFTHALIQEGAYSSLLKRQRCELHLCAAAWFAGRDSALHAEHLDRAGDAKAANSYLHAALEQSSQYRPERALELARRGLEIAQDSGHFELSCLEGQLLRSLGFAAESLDAYRRAGEAAGDDYERCHSWLGLAEGLDLTGAHQELIEVLVEAESIAQVQSLTLELARIYKIRGGVHYSQGEIQDCLEANTASLKFARDVGSLEAEAQALSGLGDAECSRGRFISAFHHFDRCVELAQEHGFGGVIAANQQMRAWVSQWQNEFKSSTEDYCGALELAVKTRQARSEMNALLIGGEIWIRRGDLIEGEKLLMRCLAITRRLSSRGFEGTCLGLLGRIRLLQGNQREALELVQEAIDILRESESGMTQNGPYALGLLGLATQDADQRRLVLTEGEALLEVGSVGHNYLEFYVDAMEVCLQISEWDEVDRYARALEDYTHDEPLPRSDLFIARGRVLAAHGRGNRDQETMEELQRLHDKVERVGLKFALPALEIALVST